MISLILVVSACAGHRPKAYSLIQEAEADGATARQARHTLAHLYPEKYRAAQRAIITVGRRQYVCDGLLTASPENGHHLALISTLGLVTELLVRTNQADELLRSTPLFREDWSRNFVARDLRLLFAPNGNAVTPGRLLDGRFVLQSGPAEARACASVRAGLGQGRADATAPASRLRYVFTSDGLRLQEVEIECGGRRVYHAVVRRYRTFAGVDRPVPSEITVVTPNYRLDLRTADLSPATAAKQDSARPGATSNSNAAR